MPPRPPRPSLFPYTTLFRSSASSVAPYGAAIDREDRMAPEVLAELRRAGLFGMNVAAELGGLARGPVAIDRKSTRLNSSHLVISYAVFCLNKKSITASAPQK